MITGDAVKELATRFRNPEILGTGHIAMPGDWNVVDPASIFHPGPQAAALPVYTLGALCDYLKANRDELPLPALVIHVVSPSLVRLLGRLHTVNRVREAFIEAKAIDLTDGFVGKLMTLEEAIVGLQARFVDGPAREDVRRLLSNIETSAVQTSTDDGVSQTVTAKVGIARKADVTVPNPVLLQPYRSFREVTQPTVPFIVRMESRDGNVQPRVVFHEADGGAWRVGAINAVVAYLKSALNDGVITLDIAILG